MTDRTEADAVAEIVGGAAGVNSSPLPAGNGGNVPGVLVREKRGDSDAVRTLDLEKFSLTPVRKRGFVALHEQESFLEYVQAHKDPGSRIYASLPGVTVVGVLNDDPDGAADGAASWRDHRAILTLHRTPEWERWKRLDGKLVDQTTFAEHLEISLNEIVAPASADLVEIARTFTASTSTQFRSAQKLDNGEVQIRYEQEISARAGVSGDVVIPQAFMLSLALFRGEQPTQIIARLRYRLDDGKLRIGYFLDKPDEAELHAFTEMVNAIRESSSLPTLMGTPPDYWD